MTTMPDSDTHPNAHRCKCNVIHDCPIFVHPDDEVQKTLADLSDVLARYDERTGSVSLIIVHSDHGGGGMFHSITENTQGK